MRRDLPINEIPLENVGMRRILPAILCLCCQNIGQPSLTADDWPRWRGPHLDGISREKDWQTNWPQAGPKRVWQAKVGTGFSSVTVANGRVFTMGNKGDRDTIYCLAEETGNTLWSHSYDSPLAPRYYDGGPSSSPTVDGKTVYSLGRQGELYSFDFDTGKVHWQKNIAHEIKAAYPEWGYAGSPYVADNLLVLNVGTAGLAVNKRTGKLVWQTGSTTSGYSTPFPLKQGEVDCLAIFGAEAMHVVETATGRKVWQHPWNTSWDINVADPIIQDQKMFISSGYDRGCALVDISGSKPSVIWENRNMRNHFNSCILINGYLYGFDGNSHRGRAFLACISFASGEKKWSTGEFGYGSLAAADGKLIVLGARGQLAVAEASPKGFSPIARTQALGGLCWTPPVLANGHLFCRNSRGDLVRLSLK